MCDYVLKGGAWILFAFLSFRSVEDRVQTGSLSSPLTRLEELSLLSRYDPQVSALKLLHTDRRPKLSQFGHRERIR